MLHRYSLRKLAAVSSSVLLVAGFISYRAGAFDRFLAPGPQPADYPSSQPIDSALSDGSNSGAVVPGPAPSQPTPPRNASQSPTIMSSSKYVIVGDYSTPGQSASPPPAADPAAPSNSATPVNGTNEPAHKPTILPGSKSAVILPTPNSPSQRRPPAP